MKLKELFKEIEKAFSKAEEGTEVKLHYNPINRKVTAYIGEKSYEFTESDKATK